MRYKYKILVSQLQKTVLLRQLAEISSFNDFMCSNCLIQSTVNVTSSTSPRMCRIRSDTVIFVGDA